MAGLVVALVVCVIFITPWAASGTLVQYNFIVGSLNVTRLCKQQEIVTVNGLFPGPTIYVREGDNLVVHVKNEARYNISIHWHGIRQLKSGWADGPAYITQCPISEGGTYTYNFRIIQQVGTLWWHAHISWLRATVYGALVIRPRIGHHYPFIPPAAEVPIILGEWWNANITHVLEEGILTGVINGSDAFTINTQPGGFYPCSATDTFRLLVERRRTYLLRIINAALNEPLFFKIANHTLTVVAVDASYTKPYKTDVVVIYPGQTTDLLLTADQPSGSYYMAARAYQSAPLVPFNNSTTTAIIQYQGTSRLRTVPLMPSLPNFNDTPTAHKFSTELRSLLPRVPQTVDEEMLITMGIGLETCPNGTCKLSGGVRLVGSFNNVSFVRPQIALLKAYFFGEDKVFSTDFPSNPPLVFNYTAQNQRQDILFPELGTKVKVLGFNSNVQIVFQGTSLLSPESHPIHIHGFDFYIVGQGFGNYDPHTDPARFNLKNPQRRNTIGVPTGGWAAIRFKADNPGVWFVHCHFEAHSEFGFNMVFLVKDGPGTSNKLPPPPLDLPKC